ncbi:MAG: peptidase T [Clostridia bacterium]|nr:peptidase T [Clostridia bacterium]
MDIKERFLKYVSFHTSSDEESVSCPSTARQLALAEYLADELKSIGLHDACFTEKGYVYAHLASNCGSDETIGFIAHMDTSPSAPGDNVRPRSFIYEGGDIELGGGVVTAVKDFPFLSDYKNKELIVTDGTTLLGADDKAGVAEIMSAVEYLVNHPEIKRKNVSVAFTPDEEVGRGTESFDIEKFGAKAAYTVDGGALGEIEYECFNASSAKITVKGVNIHPGSAKNKMKNAVLMAADFVSRLPAAETPAHTEGYEGFYHLCEMSGDESSAVIKLIIRDHSREKFENRKEFIRNLTHFMNSVYGECFSAEIKDSYYNMRELIEQGSMWLVEDAENAMKTAGVSPKIVAIRGGTDGAMLTYKGLPCPNLSTGGENFHGVHEFVCVNDMKKMVEVILNLCENN